MSGDSALQEEPKLSIVGKGGKQESGGMKMK